MGLKLDLTKGMKLDLTKQGNTKFKVGLSWLPAESGSKIDVDACAFILRSSDGTNKLEDIRDCVYHQVDKTFEKHPSGAVILSPDNQDGISEEGEYDEELTIDTSKLPDYASQVNIYINIYRPKVSFNKIKDCKAIIEDGSGDVLAGFNMSEQLTDENSILVGVIKKSGDGFNWEFEARGEGYKIEDLNTIVETLNVKGSN